MADGGFDVVISNPPYVFTREQFTSAERAYYANRYPCGWEKRNTFLLFMELLPRLLRKTGRGGYIVPNSWLTIESAQLVRALYANQVRELIDLNYAVFEDAVVEPCIFTVDGDTVTDRPLVLRAHSAVELASRNPIPIDRSLWERSHGRFAIPDNAVEISLVDTMFAMRPRSAMSSMCVRGSKRTRRAKDSRRRRPAMSQVTCTTATGTRTRTRTGTSKAVTLGDTRWIGLGCGCSTAHGCHSHG